MDLAIEAAESQEMGKPIEQHSANYARGALPYITPKLTQLLTQQTDDDAGDSEEWSPAKAAGVCLMNLGKSVLAFFTHYLRQKKTIFSQYVRKWDFKSRDAIYCFKYWK